MNVIQIVVLALLAVGGSLDYTDFVKSTKTMTSNLRHDEAVRLREAGVSYAEIGRRWSISRERMRQIMKGKPTLHKSELNSKIMLTVADVAHLLGVHINTVRRWSNNGILKAYRLGPRGDRRFWCEDIDRFLND